MKNFTSLLVLVLFVFNCTGNIKTYNKALDLHTDGSLSEAERYYKDALKDNPDDPDINNNLGCLYLSQKYYIEAEKYLKKAISLKSNDYKFHYNLGLLYQETGMQEEGVAGLVDREKGKKREAIEEFEKCLKLKSDLFEALYNLGNLYFDLNEFEKAEEYYLRCQRINPQFPEVFYNLGLFYFTTKNREKAIEYYEKYVGLIKDPDEISGVNQIISKLKNNDYK